MYAHATSTSNFLIGRAFRDLLLMPEAVEMGLLIDHNNASHLGLCLITHVDYFADNHRAEPPKYSVLLSVSTRSHSIRHRLQ